MSKKLPKARIESDTHGGTVPPMPSEDVEVFESEEKPKKEKKSWNQPLISMSVDSDPQVLPTKTEIPYQTVEIFTSAKGAKQYRLKIKHDDPDVALKKAKEMSDELDEYVSQGEEY